MLAITSFARRFLDSEKAQSRFLTLLERHRKSNSDFASASGIVEQRSRATPADLIAVYNDYEQQKANKSKSERKRREEG